MEFALAEALFLFVVPIGVLALAFAPRRPVRAATGTLALWKRAVREESVRGTRSRWRPPAWLLVVVAGLACWVLALAHPRLPAADREEWHVLVDRRPRMLLTSDAGSTRLASALERARTTLVRERGAVRIRWSSPGLADVVTTADEPAPVEVLASAPPARRSPVFAAHDEPGTLWLSARAPLASREAAGYVASGGAAVHGFVAAGADGWSWWDGARIERRAAPADAGLLVTSGALPELVAAFARVYAATRGLALAGEGAVNPGAVRLVIEGRAGGEPLPAGVPIVATAGTLAHAVDATALPPDGGAARVGAVARLAGGDQAPVLVLTDGRVRVASGTWEAADSERFALGLGALFDAELAPDARIVPLAGRRDQGAPGIELGALPDPLPVATDRRSLLAFVAAACFALAALLRTRSA